MTLRLRCLRCGDLAEFDPVDSNYPLGLCPECWYRKPYVGGAAFLRWCDRWQKNMARHPTYKALTAALESLEEVPHGTLDTSACEPADPEAY